MSLKIGIDIGGDSFDTPLDMFWHAVSSYPDRKALSAGASELSYRGFAAAVVSLAEQIKAYKKEQCKVAIALPNGVEFCCAVFAGWQAGSIISLHNIMQPEEALKSQFSLVEPDIIIATSDQNEVMKKIAPNTECIFLDEGCFVEGGKSVQSRPDWPIADPDDLSLFLFTGGTTGIPKAVEHSFASISASIKGMEYAWPTKCGEEIWLSISPMFHIYGLLFCVMNPVFSIATNVMGYPFRTENAVQLMKEQHVTVFSGGPPAVYAALLSNLDFNEDAFQHLRICGGGAAPFAKDMLDRWHTKTGTLITEAYGMTEVAPITANNNIENGNRQGSVGRAGPRMGLRILDLDTGDVLHNGETGGIFVSSPQVMRRYYNNPVETENILKDGWLETGDVGHLDEDGFLFITGRIKEMISVSGYKVYPREVDDIFSQHPSVLESCTLGIPDSRSGEAVVSCLVLQKGKCLTEEDVKEYILKKLSHYKCPKYVFFMDEIPKTPARKQDRQSLLKLLTEDAP